MKKFTYLFFVTFLFVACDGDLPDLTGLCENKVITVSNEVGSIDDPARCEEGVPCSLRDAIHTANSVICADEVLVTINLPEGAEYILSDGEIKSGGLDGVPIFGGLNFKNNGIDVPTKIILNGNGSSIKLIGGNDVSIPDHLFFVSDKSDVTFNDLHFETGTVQYDDWDDFTIGVYAFNHMGGAIHNQGSIEVNNCTFNNCVAEFGGAIFNASEAMINQSIFDTNYTVHNEGTTIGLGGAIYNFENAQITLNDCEFKFNRAQGGAALYNDTHAEAVIHNSDIYGNKSDEIHGPITNHGVMGIHDSNLFDNVPLSVENFRDLLLRDCDFYSTNAWEDENEAAIFSRDKLTIANCTFRDFEDLNEDALPVIRGLDYVQIQDSYFYNNHMTEGVFETQAWGTTVLDRNVFTSNIGSYCVKLDNPTVYLNSNNFTDNDGIGLDAINIESMDLINNTFFGNSSFYYAAAVSVIGNDGDLRMFHNSIASNQMSTEFGDFEVAITGTFSDIEMKNNIVWNQVQSDVRPFNFPDAFNESFDISHNYVSSSDTPIPNQIDIESDLIISSNETPIELHGIQLHILEAWQNSVPWIPSVSVDINGSPRTGAMVDPGSVEYF